MSYILDALKKSEQQRGNSTISPDITATAAHPTPAKHRLVLPLILLAAALAAGWYMLQMNQDDRHQSPAPVSGSMPPPPPVLHAQKTAAHNRTVPKQPASATNITTAVVVEPEHHASPPVSHATNPLPVFKPITPTSSVSRIAGSLPDVPDSTTQAAPAETNNLAISQLPLSVQQALPAMHIEGHIYDDNPAARMVIVNGTVYREKQHITGVLILEEITPKGVILNYQGHVFHMGVFE